MALEFDYDLMVLDLNLPGVDGLSILKSVRQHKTRLPVMILTARNRVEDRVQCLDTGADDYLVKPFAMQELLARVRALVRRQAREVLPVLKVGDLEVDRATRRVRRGTREIGLTQKEYQLLEYLMRRPSVVHTRTMIAEHVWNFGLDQASNVVDVYVKHLRDKIDDRQLPDAPSFIQSVRGVGYVLRDPRAD